MQKVRMISYYGDDVLLFFKHGGFLQGRERENWEHLLKMQVLPPTEEFDAQPSDLQTQSSSNPLTPWLIQLVQPSQWNTSLNRVTLHTANIQPTTLRPFNPQQEQN